MSDPQSVSNPQANELLGPLKMGSQHPSSSAGAARQEEELTVMRQLC
jgi:hypothetical protein